jgi:hypothetical protein
MNSLQTQRRFATSQRPTLPDGESTRNFTPDAELEVRKFELRMARADSPLKIEPGVFNLGTFSSLF